MWHKSIDTQIKALDLPLKGALSILRQFLAIESPLKRVKKLFISAILVLNVFKFLSTV